MEKVTFWYGCNVLRHGDIIRACIDILERIGIEAVPVGGPNYCCGSVKDGNVRAADGMASRTIDRMNEKGNERMIAWCPSCHSQMDDIMSKGYRTQFSMDYLVEVLYENRHLLAPHLTRAVPLRVLVHRHVGFHDKVPVNTMVPELLSMVPGLDVIEDEYRAPSYMCLTLARVPTALQAMLQQTRNTVKEHKADALVTIFHQCYRELCGLQVQGLCEVYNYIHLLASSMGIEREDEYKQWKLAGAEAQELVGEQRIELIGGHAVFDKLIRSELLKLPPEGESN